MREWSYISKINNSYFLVIGYLKIQTEKYGVRAEPLASSLFRARVIRRGTRSKRKWGGQTRQERKRRYSIPEVRGRLGMLPGGWEGGQHPCTLWSIVSRVVKRGYSAIPPGSVRGCLPFWPLDLGCHRWSHIHPDTFLDQFFCRTLT